MKKLKVYASIILALSMFQFYCNSSNDKNNPEGGLCEYSSYEGYAVIKAIKAAPASEYNCPNNARQVVFEFTPDNISDRQKYRFTNVSDSPLTMKINDGANPSLTWIKNNKITVGAKFKCIRTEITKGTCTPVVFKFPELNLFPETGCN